MALAAVVVGAAFMWFPITEAAGRSVSRSVPSDFFEDAAPPAARSSSEGLPVAGAPYDVGNDAVPLPNEFESARTWSLSEDASSASRPRPGPLSLVSAQSGTVSASAARQGSAIPLRESSSHRKQEEVNEDAAPRPNRQTQSLRSQQEQEQQVAQRQREQAMQQERAELQRQQQLQLQMLQREQDTQSKEAQTTQQAQQQAQQQTSQQQQQQQQQQLLQVQQQQAQLRQQQQAQQLQQQLLQMAQLQGQRQGLQQSQGSQADAAEEATSFFEEQGDLGGRDPLSLSTIQASPAAGASQQVGSGQSVAQAAREEQEDKMLPNSNVALLSAQSAPLSHQPQQQAPPQPPMPQLRGSADEQVKKIREQQLYLQNLQQSLQQALVQNASRFGGGQTLAGTSALQSFASDTEFMPKHEDCTPRCAYKCTNPTCEEECQPQCESPKCQTRCTGMELSGCRMQCGQPHCSVICPSKMCSGKDCQQCSAKCSEPMCMLQCPKAQPCHNVCEQPKCEWKCKAPTSCPKPTCDMVCESPQSCAGNTYKELPPLKPGELSVLSFKAPAELAAEAQAKADMAVKSQTPAPQQRGGSFMEMGVSSSRGGLQRDYPSLQSSALHVPVESLPEDGTSSRGAWPAMFGQSSPQTQQWTARMPVSQGWENPLKGYYAKDLSSPDSEVAA